MNIDYTDDGTDVDLSWDSVPGSPGYRVSFETKTASAVVPNNAKWVLVEAMGDGRTEAETYWPVGVEMAMEVGTSTQAGVTTAGPSVVTGTASLAATLGVVTSGLVTSANATLLPTYELHIKPNYYVQSDGAAAGYRVVWVDHQSPTANVMPNGDVRTIASPDAVHASATIKSWVWWFAWELMIDGTWDPSRQGNWGTVTPNCHNSANDVGNSIHGGIGWGFGAGTSSVQSDYIGGNLYQHIQNDSTKFPDRSNLIQSNLSKGVWHSVLMELTLGRSDGSITDPTHPYNGAGRIRTWLDGSNSEVDTGPTNTLQKAVKNDDPNSPLNGQTFVQTLMDCWSGFYTGFADSMELIISTTAVRIGRTLPECLADVPVKVGDRVANLYDGSGTNLGPSFYNTLTGASQRTDQTFQVPSELV